MGTYYVSDKGFSETLDFLIIALCRDFETRERSIKEKSCNRRTLMEYEYINRRIMDAAREIVGESYGIYIKEIGERIGYAYSRIDHLSETDYKVKKREVKLNIARKMHLLD